MSRGPSSCTAGQMPTVRQPISQAQQFASLLSVLAFDDSTRFIPLQLNYVFELIEPEETTLQ